MAQVCWAEASPTDKPPARSQGQGSYSFSYFGDAGTTGEPSTHARRGSATLFPGALRTLLHVSVLSVSPAAGVTPPQRSHPNTRCRKLRGAAATLR